MVQAENRFLDPLKKVTDPEKKRKIIGTTFIKIFEEEAKRLGSFDFLAQGTLYPDVIESVSFKGGPSATIKTHHKLHEDRLKKKIFKIGEKKFKKKK